MHSLSLRGCWLHFGYKKYESQKYEMKNRRIETQIEPFYTTKHTLPQSRRTSNGNCRDRDEETAGMDSETLLSVESMLMKYIVL